MSVTFEFPQTPWCESVCLAGDFNGWSHNSLPLHRPEASDSPWRVTLELPRDKEFEYRYVVNRVTWNLDERADGQVETFGGEVNSLVRT